MNKINLTKLKADAEARLSDAPDRARMMTSAEHIPRAVTMTREEWKTLETTLILIDALERARFALNKLCNCGNNATWCDPCTVVGFMREQIDFGGA